MPTHAIRAATAADADAICELYCAVAARPGGLAREQDEITTDYVRHFLRHSLADGVCLVAQSADGLVGEIHAYTRGIRAFAHVLGDLTVAVHPQAQGRGIGRTLFEGLKREIEARFPHIVRLELLARESNAHAIRLYESLGFRREGRFEARVRGVNGELEADIPMAWIRPILTR
jgi:ribosomal protein S18 acetylase RimI-like enzyme